MITGIIDLGTNTFNLMIRDTEKQEVIFMDKISVRLGEGGLNSNTIAKPAFDRGMEALKKYMDLCREHKTDDVYAFATSAIRGADNKDEFVREALSQASVNVNVIDGDKEAELIYYGVKQSFDLPDEAVLIMDIGGGSTEFIISRKDDILWKKSYLLGCSRLMEKFRPSDPILSAEIERLNEYHEEELKELIQKAKEHQVKILIGSSGSFDTLAAMVGHKYHNPEVLENRTHYIFDMYEYRSIAKLMLSLDFDKRLNTPGMVPMRADLIVIACVQINFVINHLGIKSLVQSAYALKEGVFKTLENNDTIWQKSLL